jgi:nucleotide-binding universal stress UspA family protein
LTDIKVRAAAPILVSGDAAGVVPAPQTHGEENMSKILLALDGSPASRKALMYVENRFKKDAGLRVVAVTAAHYQTVEEAAKKKEVPLAQRDVFRNEEFTSVLNRIGAECVKIGEEDAAEAIIRACRQHACEEIVMGTRGLGALKGLLLGSVATKVAQLAEVPVILVK